MVIGPPHLICSLKIGMTEPDEPNTLPNRTIEIFIFDGSFAAAWQINSAKRFVAPITLVGLTALSVEIKVNDSQRLAMAEFSKVAVPNTLFVTATNALASTNGTCLYAAA
jgi:hypothetical protein